MKDLIQVNFQDFQDGTDVIWVVPYTTLNRPPSPPPLTPGYLFELKYFPNGRNLQNIEIARDRIPPTT